MQIALGLSLTRAAVGGNVTLPAAQDAPFGALTLDEAGGFQPLDTTGMPRAITSTGTLPTGLKLLSGAIVADGNGLGANSPSGTVTVSTAHGDVAVTFSTVAGAYSVAPGDPATSAQSLSQVNAAVQVASFGDRILCRPGDYGFARDSLRRNVGHDDLVADPLTETSGDLAADGPITIEPHDQANRPRFWNVVVERFKGLEFNNVLAMSRPDVQQLGGEINTVAAPIRFHQRGSNTLSHCGFQGCDAITYDATPDDWTSLRCYFSFDCDAGTDLDMPDCYIRDCTGSGGAYDAVRPGGTRFELMRCEFSEIVNDGVQGGGQPTEDHKAHFNLWHRNWAPVEISLGVSSISFAADGTVTLHLDAGDVATVQSDYPGFGSGLTGGWNLSLKGYETIPALADYMAHRHEFAVDGWDLAYVASPPRLVLPATNTLIMSGTTYGRLRNWFTANGVGDGTTIATPGCRIVGTEAHNDLAVWGGDTNSTTPANDGREEIGNIYVQYGEGWSHEASLGAPNGSDLGADWIIAGNMILGASLAPSFDADIDGGEIVGNVALAGPFSPGWEVRSPTGPRFDIASTGALPIFAYNMWHSGGPTGGVDVDSPTIGGESTNLRLGNIAAGGAALEAEIEAQMLNAWRGDATARLTWAEAVAYAAQAVTPTKSGGVGPAALPSAHFDLSAQTVDVPALKAWAQALVITPVSVDNQGAAYYTITLAAGSNNRAYTAYAKGLTVPSTGSNMRLFRAADTTSTVVFSPGSSKYFIAAGGGVWEFAHSGGTQVDLLVVVDLDETGIDKCKAWIDGVGQTLTETTAPTGDIDMAQSFGFLADAFGASIMDAQTIENLFFSNSALAPIDFSSGNPSGLVDVRGDLASWNAGTNRGSAGSLSLTSTFIAAP